MSSPGDAEDDRVEIAPLIRVLLIIGVLAPITGVILDLLLHFRVTDSGLVDGIRNQLYPDAEGNFDAWYSTILLAAIGVGFLLIAMATRGAGKSLRLFVALAVLALALSLDEAAALHERLAIFASELGLTTRFTYVWLLFGIPIAIVVGAFVLWLARNLEKTLRRRLVIAGIVFLAGAAGFELLGGIIHKVDLGLSRDATYVVYALEVLIEETLETIGAILALRAVLLHLRVSNGPEGLAFSLPPGR